MQDLVAFEKLSSSIQLQADVERIGAKIKLIFALSDPQKIIDVPEAFEVDGEKVKRADSLWNETCFEMFLRPAGKKYYFEFNFSLLPAWNEYFFTDYRTPQPPEVSNEIVMQSMQWDGQRLKIELLTQLPQTNFEISLTAILKEKSGVKHFMALAHKGAKADFHLADSFILKR